MAFYLPNLPILTHTKLSHISTVTLVREILDLVVVGSRANRVADENEIQNDLKVYDTNPLSFQQRHTIQVGFLTYSTKFWWGKTLVRQREMLANLR